MNYADLKTILISDQPSLRLKANEAELIKLIPEIKPCIGFNQNNPWHIYPVYDHILHVVDGVSNDINVRLAALFHDLGKPACYQEDNEGIGHFKDHWQISKAIFLKYADKFDLTNQEIELVGNLVYYHDLRHLDDKLNIDEQKALLKTLGETGIIMLYDLKKADLLAQNEKYHYLLKELMEEKQKMLALEKE